MAKLRKRTVGALVTVVWERKVAYKVVRILNKRIDQVEKANERLIRENLSQSLRHRFLRRTTKFQSYLRKQEIDTSTKTKVLRF